MRKLFTIFEVTDSCWAVAACHVAVRRLLSAQSLFLWLIFALHWTLQLMSTDALSQLVKGEDRLLSFSMLCAWLSCSFVFWLCPCQVIRGHKFNLCKRQNTHSVRANFFSERVTTHWNSLPDTVDFSSFTSFKRTVKQVNLTQFVRIQVCN